MTSVEESVIIQEFAPATVVIAALALLLSVTICIWTTRGIHRSRRERNAAPNAQGDSSAATAASASTTTIAPSKSLEDFSFGVIVCFTISCIAYLPEALNGTYFDYVGPTPIFFVFIFWFFGYIMMFLVFVRRLKEIDGLSTTNQNVCIVLLVTLSVAFVSFMVVTFGDIGGHHLKSILMAPGIVAYFCFAVLVMVLFTRKLFQQMKVGSDPEMLQNPELLDLITRYTVLGFVGIFTSICTTLTWAAYYVFFVDRNHFMDLWVFWILPMDEIVNMICIALYLPFAVTTYEKMCCVAHSCCKRQCEKMLIDSNDDVVDKAERTQDV